MTTKTTTEATRPRNAVDAVSARARALLGLGNAPPTTEADDRDLATCIEVLVENAVSAGARNVRIVIDAGRKLVITDDGDGIRDTDRFPLRARTYRSREPNRPSDPEQGAFLRVLPRMAGRDARSIPVVQLVTTNRHGRTRMSFQLGFRPTGYTNEPIHPNTRLFSSGEVPHYGSEIAITPLVIALDMSAAELEARLQGAHPGVAFTVRTS